MESLKSRLFMAIYENNLDLAEKYLEAGDDPNFQDPLHLAVCNSNVAIVKLLLKYRANVNHSGESALHLALQKVNYTIVKLLLRAGANPNFQDASGRTPLFHAAGQNIDVVRDLLVAGANPNIKTNKGGTLLYQALNDVVSKIICIELIEAGANLIGLILERY